MMATLGHALVLVVVGVACMATAFQVRGQTKLNDLDPPELVPVLDVNAPGYDVLLVVTETLDNLVGQLAPIREVVDQQRLSDVSFGLVADKLVDSRLPTGAMVFHHIGRVVKDDITKDVRTFEDAFYQAIHKVSTMGKTRPLLVLARGPQGTYDTDLLVSVLGALHALYVPIEKREAGDELWWSQLGVWGAEAGTLSHTLTLASVLEKARIVTRDICASDPERMAAPRVEEYVRGVFNSTPDIRLNVVSDQAVLQRDYPILAAVNRAASTVDRHRARLIFLEYQGGGQVEDTIFLLGKGITFDSGGANLKTGIRMESMHRDKCGAAVVAGFFKALSLLKPARLRVVGAMPMVRNSIGEEAYVPDEIITARSGQRVRIGNTDAEGRNIMADVLCHFKEMAVAAVKPHVLTVATLTGHAMSTAGKEYSIVLDSGAARGTAETLSHTGDLFADPLEVSRLRPEDFTKHVRPGTYADLYNHGKAISSARGHQAPTAFLMQVSGIHPEYSRSLPYTHVDIAGPSMAYPGSPQCSPLIVLASHFLLSPHDKALLARGTGGGGGGGGGAAEDKDRRKAAHEREREEEEEKEEGLFERFFFF